MQFTSKTDSKALQLLV